MDDDEVDEDEILILMIQSAIDPLTPLIIAATVGHRQTTTSFVCIEGEEITSRVTSHLHIQRSHPPNQMIGGLYERVTRSKFIDSNSHIHSAFVAFFEPKDASHALTDESWINTIYEEFENFESNKV